MATFSYGMWAESPPFDIVSPGPRVRFSRSLFGLYIDSPVYPIFKGMSFPTDYVNI